MFNNFKTYNYSLSNVTPDGLGRHEGAFLNGDIINGFDTVIGTGLQVIINPGNALIRIGTGGTTSARLVSLTAAFTGTLATADASNPRIDAIVMYVDTSVNLPGGTPTSANSDGPGVTKVAYVSGTPNASPVAPSTAAIQTAIGSASYPYTILANWRVDAGAATLSQSKCTDTRVFATPTNPRAIGNRSMIESGCNWTYTNATLNGAGTAGQVLIAVGTALVPQPVAAASKTFTANRDTYIYVTLGNSTPQYSEQTIGGINPTLPANSVLVAVVYSTATIQSASNQKPAGSIVTGTIPAATFGSTGVKRITGIGGTPKIVRFTIMPTASTTVSASGSGGMTSSGQFWVFTSAFGSNLARESGATACIVIRSSGANTPLVTASYSSMDVDGFSINVTTAATVYDVAYEVYA
ncbi:hypothetical protein AB0280_15550 [Pseudarthrobacter sp902506025]|uniref:hypothetical protein n=1 Tax=Pseudarthrobacter sp. 902506025 TaxID=3155291 RepID=UPI00344B4155